MPPVGTRYEVESHVVVVTRAGVVVATPVSFRAGDVIQSVAMPYTAERSPPCRKPKLVEDARAGVACGAIARRR